MDGRGVLVCWWQAGHAHREKLGELGALVVGDDHCLDVQLLGLLADLLSDGLGVGFGVENVDGVGDVALLEHGHKAALDHALGGLHLGVACSVLYDVSKQYLPRSRCFTSAVRTAGSAFMPVAVPATAGVRSWNWG